MNKILIDKKISSDSDKVKIVKNVITFLEDGEYVIEYMSSGNYEIVFEINNDVKINECSFDKELNLNNHYIINKGNVEINKFYNNDKVLEKIDIDLCSYGSSVNYNFANICKGYENYIININHMDKKTISNINNKSLALKNSDISFEINSNVSKDGNGSVLDQNTRIVTLGECNTSIKPNMYIDLDDVSAKHGSVIGTFKKEDIFYLMSKGISYDDSLKLLIRGYLLANLKVTDEIKEEIIKIINMYWR